MKFPVVASCKINRAEPVATMTMVTWATMAGCALVVLTGCASEPQHASGAGGGRYFDARLGVWASPRLIADGEAVPRGGGGYLVGRPYVIAGHTYYPSEQPHGYSVVGTASWYGDAFHGRRTANGEIFDKGSITAAHPTLPLPSYVRVTNLKNNRSMIVRVNDRGPYHGGRVMDVSQRVAEALAFKGEGTARIRVDYVGRASLAGSDDEKLISTLRVDGGPAQMAGFPPSIDVALTTPDDNHPASASAPLPAPLPAPAPPHPARQPVLAVARPDRGSLRAGLPLPLFTPLAGPRPPQRTALVRGRPARYDRTAAPALVPTSVPAPHGVTRGVAASAPDVAAVPRGAVSATRGDAAPRSLFKPLFADPGQGSDSAEVAPESR